MSNGEVETDYRKVIESIARKNGELLKVFMDFTCMAACALAMKTREDEYLEIAKTYSKEQLNQFGEALGLLIEEMESKPFEDLLGTYYNEIGSRFSRDMRGEFYTPKPVSDLMARVTVDVDSVIAAGKPISVNDPASGSGGMILSLAECFAKAKAVDLLRITCQDISKTACDMAYINLTLWGIPARVRWGDTLRATVQKGWLNIHWHRVGEPDRERIGQFMRLLDAPPQPETTPEEAQVPSRPPGSDSTTAATEAAQLQPCESAPSASTPTRATIHHGNSGQHEWVFE